MAIEAHRESISDSLSGAGRGWHHTACGVLDRDTSIGGGMRLVKLLGRVVLGAVTVVVMLIIALGVAIGIGVPISLD